MRLATPVAAAALALFVGGAIAIVVVAAVLNRGGGGQADPLLWRSYDGSFNHPHRLGTTGRALVSQIRCPGTRLSGTPPLHSAAALFGGPWRGQTPRASSLAWVFAQFVDHDIVFTRKSDTLNLQTPYLDASVVYGASSHVTDSLREFSGGRLRANGTLLPGWPRFVAGDVRVNTHALLIAMQTLWMREHNYWADRFASYDTRASDETTFQRARAIVAAEIQRIVYEEWLPVMIGAERAAKYTPRAYNARIDPRMRTEFSTACYRFGHSMVTSAVGSLTLLESFSSGVVYVRTHGIEDLLVATAEQRAEAVDLFVVDAMRTLHANFTMPIFNLMRGRERGICSYADFRFEWETGYASTWGDVTSDAQLADALSGVYGPNPSAIGVDPFVGMLAEDTEPGVAVPPTAAECMGDQFRWIAAADSYFYKWYSGDAVTASQWPTVRATAFGDVLRRHGADTGDAPFLISD